MPTYAKSEDWLLQSSLLLEARPETTRITTRYTIRPHIRRTKKSSPPPSSSSDAPSTNPPRGHLELKTYDPVSGACLKYRTVKLAEVGRLMQLLGNRLARTQAGVPVREDGEAGEDVVMADAAGEAGSGVATPVGGGGEKGVADKAAGGGGGGGGGKGRKKKGKR
ncbi:hypothetical protein NKR19_g4629 [Coniochaeta hoffmannii]|uniref:SRP9 domain-containing protein n=1 Tax=Coniochaeta hoffmannii TaxID=91930 RepID=A0AA38VXZ1_9PEZI|nr:hypothetical protein NKR19_g4629 [Coniochaeta hoffmannii]